MSYYVEPLRPMTWDKANAIAHATIDQLRNPMARMEVRRAWRYWWVGRQLQSITPPKVHEFGPLLAKWSVQAKRFVRREQLEGDHDASDV